MMAWISLTNEVVETMAASYVDNQFQFAEMNIRYTGNMEKLLSLLRRAIRMGYDSIVVNTDVGDPENSPCDVVKIVFRLVNLVVQVGGVELTTVNCFCFWSSCCSRIYWIHGGIRDSMVFQLFNLVRRGNGTPT